MQESVGMRVCANCSRLRGRWFVRVIFGLIVLLSLSTACSGAGGPGSSVASNDAAAVSTPVALYPVAEVVDGDTLKVRMDARVETVRLIGVDTPEAVDPRRPVQCFGREASARARDLLSGKQVRVEQDPSQDTRDRFGRLLAYVWLEDGTFVNQALVAEGYAHEYTFAVPYRYQAEFKRAEREAREQRRGLWSPSTCAGNTKRPAQ
jgi:micrococcal nuclease